MTVSKLLIGATLLSLASTGLAYGPMGGGPGYGGGYRLAQELNLTAEQQEQVQDIMVKHREEGWAYREQHRKDLETKLSTVLTPEQLDEFVSFRQNKPYGRGRGGPYGGNRGRCNMNR